MEDDNLARMDILMKVIYDASLAYSNSHYPNLKKDNYEILVRIWKQIKTGLKLALIDYPNVNSDNIPPEPIFATFLQQQHEIDLSPEEMMKIKEMAIEKKD